MEKMLMGDLLAITLSGLSQNQLEFLNNNLDDETQITNDNLILKTKFKKGSVLKLSNFFLFLF